MSDPLYDEPKAAKGSIREVTSRPTARAISLPELSVAPGVGIGAHMVEDEHDTAVRMAFLGSGQGGGRLVESFWTLGYRRVAVVNTTAQDMAALAVPNKLLIGKDRGGAGKDPTEGAAAAAESSEEILDLMVRSFGDGVEKLWICLGAGGGSGTGSWPKLVERAAAFCEATSVAKPTSARIGVILTLPKRGEGARVQQNAHVAVLEALAMLQEQRISSLVIVDNAKIHELFPKEPIKTFWAKANMHFASTLHTLNVVACLDSEYSTFDRADFRSVLGNGLMVFGSARVDAWGSQEDVNKAVRSTVSTGLLADGIDIGSANRAGVVFVAHLDVLSELPMEYVDYAFSRLRQSLKRDGCMLHTGIYEEVSEGMRVLTIVSGLRAPSLRIEELAKLAAGGE